MRVMSWNVQGAVPPNGSKERIRNQIEFIETTVELPELLMLNEVTTVQREFWRELLHDELSYREVVDTLDWAAELRESEVPPHQDFNHVNGNLIAVHETCEARELNRRRPTIREGLWEDAVLKDWSTNFPEKILTAELEFDDSTIELWNIRAIPGSSWGEEKIKILEDTINRITKGEQRPRILAGDFNSPKDELSDGTIVPWGLERDQNIRRRWIEAELNILTGLTEVGMVDVFRAVNGYGDLNTEDVSFQSKRFDHIFASKQLNPEDCYYDHGGFDCSDHAPLIAEFGL